MKEQKEKFLLFRIRVHRDPQAFSELYREYLPVARRYLAMKLPTHEDIEDTLSVTFTRLWSYLRSTEVESVSGLVNTIARGVVAEFYRKHRIQTVSLEHTKDGATLTVDVQDEKATSNIQEQSEMMLLRKKIDLLENQDYRRILVLYYVDGIQLKDIARKLHKSERAVYLSLKRAVKALQKLYSEL